MSPDSFDPTEPPDPAAQGGAHDSAHPSGQEHSGQDRGGDEAINPARSFGSVVDAYDRGRPGYPVEAVRWLIGEGPLTVLELGAGTGKLTEHLVALGHDVHATDPDATMLDRLAERLPSVRISQASAEDIPAADGAYDVVVAAQSYHWFDHDRALPEIARVLKRTGIFALVWNVKDERIPWVKRLGGVIGQQEQSGGPGESLETSPYFGTIEPRDFKQWQVINRNSIQDLALSRSNISTLEPTAQNAKIAEVLAFYDDYGRGMDGMQLPYITRCFRVGVGIRPPSKAATPPPSGPPSETSAADDQQSSDPADPDATPNESGGTATRRDDDATAERPPVDPPTDDDSGVLLIDFR